MASIQYFGKYLRSLRLARGFTNVKEYLRTYPVNISEVYYRDLESGSRLITIESAGPLCEALQADVQAFYYNILKDLLPEPILNLLIRPIVADTFEKLEDRLAHVKQSEESYRSMYLKVMTDERLIMPDNAVKFFLENLELDQLLDFIYMVSETDEAELASVAKRNGIETPVAEIIEQFERLGVILVLPPNEGEKSRRICRVRPARRWKDENQGQELLTKLTLHHVENTLKKSRNQYPADESAMVYGGVYAIRREIYPQIVQRVADLVATMRGSEEDLDQGQALPYYFLLMLSPEMEWLPDGKKAKSSSTAGGAQ